MKKFKLSLIEIIGGASLLIGCFMKSSLGPRFLPESMHGILAYSNILFWAGLLICVYLWIIRDK